MEIVDILREVIPQERIRAKLIDVLSYASDAGFYHLRPKAVVLAVSEQEIKGLFALSRRHRIPLVFRTAGTSLSGQSVTDGILVDLSQYWSRVEVLEQGKLVKVQPGVIGAMVNARLRKYSRKIGPDPASINSAMMGGIISNNASGMCCGVANNAYHTIKDIRFILPSGRTYDTALSEDYLRFKAEDKALCEELSALRSEIMASEPLFQKVRDKYRTKNTVGYSVNALIDYKEPLDIMAHLLVGAEGTLGFISEAVLATIADHPEKSTGLLYFPDIYAACAAIEGLNQSGAAAVELMDRASLRSIAHIEGVPAVIASLPESAAALLVEYQETDENALSERMAAFNLLKTDLTLLEEPDFTTDPQQQALLWKVRKGMFPSVGAVRASGSTVILEDVVFPVAKLGDAILDLQVLFSKYGYENAIIFGHAKDGNIHFVVTQSFDQAKEVKRYAAFLEEVVRLVVEKYNGALKAEHGTGRNMAPFVQTEWGADIYQIMKRVKAAVDPDGMLNPGVIINEHKNAHITHLKKLPSVEQEVDKCMECGFCEYKCPSRELTMTPRRRIVARRALESLRKENKKEYKTLLKEYQYSGLDTCAVDGLCATACPVDINTGDLVKRLRRENHSKLAAKFALMTAKSFKATEALVKTALRVGGFVNRMLGEQTMERLTRAVREVIPSFPVWSPQLQASAGLPRTALKAGGGRQTVIYYPSCISRVMGDKPQEKTGLSTSMTEVFLRVSKKAGIDVMIPSGVTGTCCSQIYGSKGFLKAQQYMANKTIELLWESSKEGSLPIVMDVSSCTYTLVTCSSYLNERNKKRWDRLRIIDGVEYIHDFIIPEVRQVKKKTHITLHPVCSLQKLPGLEEEFAAVAAFFAEEVTIPLHAGCCGMAGDRGFLHPELTRSAILHEKEDIEHLRCDGYYSSSKTCEMALSDNTGKNYWSVFRLADECMVEVVGC